MLVNLQKLWYLFWVGGPAPMALRALQKHSLYTDEAGSTCNGGKLAIWGFSKTKSFQRDIQPGGWKEARKERPGRLESRESQARDQRWS